MSADIERIPDALARNDFAAEGATLFRAERALKAYRDGRGPPAELAAHLERVLVIAREYHLAYADIV